MLTPRGKPSPLLQQAGNATALVAAAVSRIGVNSPASAPSTSSLVVPGRPRSSRASRARPATSSSPARSLIRSSRPASSTTIGVTFTIDSGRTALSDTCRLPSSRPRLSTRNPHWRWTTKRGPSTTFGAVTGDEIAPGEAKPTTAVSTAKSGELAVVDTILYGGRRQA